MRSLGDRYTIKRIDIIDPNRDPRASSSTISAGTAFRQPNAVIAVAAPATSIYSLTGSAGSAADQAARESSQ